MKHPLEFVRLEIRKRFFFTFLFVTLILFGVFRVLDQPLQTLAAPAGIVSFELAGNAFQANAILDSWKQTNLQLSALAGEPNPDIVNIPYVFAAFGLGIDYLFMPLYSFALAFGILLVMARHEGWFKSLGAVAGYGAFVAAIFDAVENYALFQVLLGKVFPPYPEIAFYCAVIKFGLLIFGLIYAIAGSPLPCKK